ncbi:TATA-binding protein-associated factor 172-like [Macrosteles quadrilineatus]|uniref:TATA-binding protein-associated factor 172-like n=1 Tax=Macrosteles quadrilineatus TaxID=74068 RepID=UPI0023E2DFD1|nr:TATA-binding protein-associated factor 172-like [Macrosteles quadrilineatus]
MTSRLDRLFVLLETGSSGVTRRAAAAQLGEVQRLHPHELHTLLGRITGLLRSSAWDTRIAAGQAVTAVLDNVPQWDPAGTLDSNSENADPLQAVVQSGRLTYSSFDLKNVVSKSAYLMGSEGKEYDTEEDNVIGPEQMHSQLMQEMGLPVKLDCSVISPEDLRPSKPVRQNSQPQKMSLTKVVSEGLSCRERNRAKRIARQTSTREKTQQQPEEENEGSAAKKVKLEEGGDESIGSEPVPDNTGAWGTDAVDWPLEGLCDSLCAELFSTRWETRHGAATALRELVKIHGRGAGKSQDIPASLMQEYHQLFLEDVSLRLLCVLALDRFGDFVSDQVVAPVRETCAQTLGSVVNLMNKDRVEKVVSCLLQLLDNTDWEARHGGLLGLKYVLAVRQDMVGSILGKTLSVILAGLKDSVDDVAAVAASALIPAAQTIVSDFPHQVSSIVTAVWDLLADQDELAAACNSFMGLLAAILSLPNTSHLVSAEECVVARLWPFLSHSSSSVRRATLQTLLTLTAAEERVASWSSALLTEALRNVYQRALIEPVQETQALVERVWNNLVHNSQLSSLLVAVCPFVSCWLCLAMQPAKMHFEPSALIQTRSEVKGKRNIEKEQVASELKVYLGGSETTPAATREQNVMRCRCMAARMLGLLSCYIVKPAPGIVYTPEIETPIECYVKVLLVYLNSKSAVQRLVTGLVIAEWGRLAPPEPPPSVLSSRLHACLAEAVYYDEIALGFTRLLQDTRDFIATLKHYKLPFHSEQYGKVLTLDQIQQLAGPVASQLLTSNKLKPKVAESLEERRRVIQGAVSQTASDQQLLTVSTQAALVGAVLMLRCLPEKLTLIIKPLMDSVKREKNEILQNLSATHLAHLVKMCVDRTPCPNTKIITNLCILLRSDPEFTPRVGEPESITGADSGVESSSSSRTNTPTVNSDKFNGILTLQNQQKNAERAVFKRANSTGGRGPGRPPTTDIPLEELFAMDDEAHKLARVQRRGATAALTSIAVRLGPDVPTKLPRLWESVLTHLQDTVGAATFDVKSAIHNDSSAEDLVSSMQVLEVVSPSLHSTLLPQVLPVLDQLCELLQHPYKAVRHMSARCVATLSALDTPRVMEVLVTRVVPLLDAADCVTRRQGATECLACVAEKLQLNIVPYIVLLVVPLLGRMSDQDSSVRLLATHTFAALIQLMPLEGGVGPPVNLPSTLSRQRDRDREFLEQLFHPGTIPDYQVPVPIRATLRSYQQAGVNWLALLNKYKLHGILCDDMGLGKTLQSICIVAGDHYTRSQKFRETGSVDSVPLPSLVVCPPTLTGHWVYEVDKFLSPEYLNPLHYAGPPVEREKLRIKVAQHNLVVASYDIVRKDIDFFSSIQWNYCILDEGHVIKNGKTKSSKAIKQLRANHRLILSGTPIQNNVLELWSLFDFLMPGFLGTERQFTAKYSRPILASRDPKSTPAEQEAGVLAMEALHKQVLPFVLRRMKEDVLKDLPPKITQDYYCDLSPLQERLYEDFSRSRSLSDISSTQSNNTHIFQALRYLQNVCNHPKLVLTPQHPEFQKILAELKSHNSSLSEIEHGCKLPALKQLLLDCGIGTALDNSTAAPVVSPHRALIFCQIKAMLDIVENDLLKKHLPSVTYLRLDGSVPPSCRHNVVARFNSDPSIDVLLLTTQVGGLGLNLTTADTVIFVEHDWSPMRDLQAMDRAHRIGQKRVVNVYRLITRGTLEEKIMGLQKFKLVTANTVISGENSSLETMATDKLLDLFSLEGKNTSGRSGWPNSSSNLTMKSVLANLPDLWEETSYEEEYDLSNFVKTLRQ